MIEDIEHLDAQVQRHALRDSRVFFNPSIGVDGSRSVEGYCRTLPVTPQTS